MTSPLIYITLHCTGCWLSHGIGTDADWGLAHHHQLKGRLLSHWSGTTIENQPCLYARWHKQSPITVLTNAVVIFMPSTHFVEEADIPMLICVLISVLVLKWSVVRHIVGTLLSWCRRKWLCHWPTKNLKSVMLCCSCYLKAIRVK